MKPTLLRLFACLALIAVSASNAVADLGWLQEANDCDSFSAGIKRVFGSVKDFSTMSERQKGELSVVLFEACGPRFKECNFSVCQSYRPGSLEWLNQELSCEQFLGQMRDRYSKLGKFSALPGATKVEVGYVLQVACSPRFAECGFKRCMKEGAVPVKATPSPTPVGTPAPDAAQVAAQAQEALRKDIARQIVAQMQIAAEQSSRLTSIEVPDAISVESASISRGPVEESPQIPTSPVESDPTEVSPTDPADSQPSEGGEPVEGKKPAEERDPEADIDRLRSRPGVKKWTKQAETETDRLYSKLLAEEYAKRRVVMELAIKRETKEGAEWERVSNPKELEVVEQRRRKARSESSDPTTAAGEFRSRDSRDNVPTKSANTPGSKAKSLSPSPRNRRRSTTKGSLAPIVY